MFFLQFFLGHVHFQVEQANVYYNSHTHCLYVPSTRQKVDIAVLIVNDEHHYHCTTLPCIYQCIWFERVPFGIGFP